MKPGVKSPPALILINIQAKRSGSPENAVAAFYGIPFDQNPTGINYTEENRKDVERTCREDSIPCVWDICYQALRYDGKMNGSIEVSRWASLFMLRESILSLNPI
jgi:DNA-binding transcriptional MocR family regulator